MTAPLTHIRQTGPEKDNYAVHIAPAQERYPLLERLGEPDFLQDTSRWLVKTYDGVAETAVQIAFQTEETARDK